MNLIRSGDRVTSCLGIDPRISQWEAYTPPKSHRPQANSLTEKQLNPTVLRNHLRWPRCQQYRDLQLISLPYENILRRQLTLPIQKMEPGVPALLLGGEEPNQFTWPSKNKQLNPPLWIKEGWPPDSPSGGVLRSEFTSVSPASKVSEGRRGWSSLSFPE